MNVSGSLINMGGIGERRAKGRLCNSLFMRFSKNEKLKRNSKEGKNQ